MEDFKLKAVEHLIKLHDQKMRIVLEEHPVNQIEFKKMQAKLEELENQRWEIVRKKYTVSLKKKPKVVIKKNMGVII